MKMKNAGSGGGQRPAMTNHIQDYQSHPPLSTPPQRNSPCVPDCTYQALGALLIYLLGRPLPQTERALGWRLAEIWLGELVGNRLTEGVTR